MYQPSHATTEIGRMRAEEMRARAERYRTIQKAKQHKKAESEEEVSLTRSRSVVYRKALGIAGLSVLMVLVFAGAALAMPAEAAPPSSVDDKHQALITKTPAGEGTPTVDGKHQALISKTQVREGPPSFWADTEIAARGEIRHLVPDPVGGQDRAETQHLVPGAIGGQERAAFQHVADQPAANFDPAPGLTSASGGIELEMVLLLSGTVALASLGALVWFRRHSMHAA
jgi:hypothetical protein